MPAKVRTHRPSNDIVTKRQKRSKKQEPWKNLRIGGLHKICTFMLHHSLYKNTQCSVILNHPTPQFSDLLAITIFQISWVTCSLLSSSSSSSELAMCSAVCFWTLVMSDSKIQIVYTHAGSFVPLSPSYTQTLVIVSAWLNSHLTCIVSNILLTKFYTVGDDNCCMLIILVKAFSKPK